jgi:hypothetical protein
MLSFYHSFGVPLLFSLLLAFSNYLVLGMCLICSIQWISFEKPAESSLTPIE